VSKKHLFQVIPTKKIAGTIRVASDKSISHRSVIFGSIAEGTTTINNLLDGGDVIATMHAFKEMGVQMSELRDGKLEIVGSGLKGLKSPNHNLDMGNSGTAMRLLAGLLAAQKFDSTLYGDESLTKRPMLRVVKPLSLMGASIETADNGTPPLTIRGNPQLKAISYRLPVASAQVKSAILLAGLYAEGETSIIEDKITRNHTELMLQTFGYPLLIEDNVISITGGNKLIAVDELKIPADISSAAFFMVAACIAEDADILLTDVGINPTRTGVIDILQLMGADISVQNKRYFGAELVADIRIKSSKLRGIDIPEHLVPLAIDEFPVLFVAAACADGETVLRGAEELKVKESDRILTMARGLQNLGVSVFPAADGIRIKGGAGFLGGEVWACQDHRIAMSFSVAALAAKDAVIIHDCANVETSFPNFVELANSIGMNIKEYHD